MSIATGLEDDLSDVFRKAARGLGISLTTLAARSGRSEAWLREPDPSVMGASDWQRLGDALGLAPSALAWHHHYLPEAPTPDWLQRLELPFQGGSVNAWLLDLPGCLLLCDAGFTSTSLLDEVERRAGRLPDRVLLTHGHRDHIAAAGHLASAGIPVHSANVPGTIVLRAGQTIFCGNIAVQALDLSGHYTPSLGFWLQGTTPGILVSGDALFAGSIGGCADHAAYQLALRQLHAALGAMPPETLILPGHGPASTVGQELAHNPFLARSSTSAARA